MSNRSKPRPILPDEIHAFLPSLLETGIKLFPRLEVRTSSNGTEEIVVPLTYFSFFGCQFR